MCRTRPPSGRLPLSKDLRVPKETRSGRRWSSGGSSVLSSRVQTGRGRSHPRAPTSDTGPEGLKRLRRQCWGYSAVRTRPENGRVRGSRGQGRAGLSGQHSVRMHGRPTSGDSSWVCPDPAAASGPRGAQGTAVERKEAWTREGVSDGQGLWAEPWGGAAHEVHAQRTLWEGFALGSGQPSSLPAEPGHRPQPHAGQAAVGAALQQGALPQVGWWGQPEGRGQRPRMTHGALNPPRGP